MPDRVYLSLWLEDFNAENMLERFRVLLERFPFSQLRPGIGALRVQALSESEPPLLEHAFAEPPAVERVIELASEFRHPDCAFLIEGWWELWQWTEGWRLLPSPVTLFCFGPLFDNEIGDHLRVELGTEAQFLPWVPHPQAGRMARSNLRSVVRLAEDLEKSLKLRQRQLWSESGENLARQLEAALTEND